MVEELTNNLQLIDNLQIIIDHKITIMRYQNPKTPKVEILQESSGVQLLKN